MMTLAAKSVFSFGLWCLLAGSGLLLLPVFLSGILGFTIAEPVYARIIGFVLIEIGILYWWLAKNAGPDAFRLTIFIRIIPLVLLTFFVATGMGPWQLILFALVDGASAAHTWWALKSEPRSTH